MRFPTALSTAFLGLALLELSCSLLLARPALAQQGTKTVVGEMTDEDPALNPEGHPFDAYGFAGVAETPVTITLTSPDYDTYMILFFEGEEGLEEIARSDNMSAESTDSELFGTLPRTGQYRIVMTTAQSTGRGTYRLTVEGL
ncbi:MAG: hypothetical protein AAF716_12570 [Cyanobacteria bacterium P01_D01_bin.1]